MVFWILAVATCTFSFIFSANRTTSEIYYVYYMLITIPSMLLFLQIFEDDAATKTFLSIFVKVGIWLSPLAIAQLLSPVPITLINNTNYSLQDYAHRAQLFTPESSILAVLYVIAICVAVFNSYRRVAESIPQGGLAFTALIAGLATTVSTTAFIVMPPLALFVFRKCGVSWKKLLGYMLFGALLLPIFYWVGYHDRLNSGDSTSSVVLRLASMVGGFQAVLPHWLTGLGLGMNKSVADAIDTIYFAWSHAYYKKAGIDSFQLSLIVEMGVLPCLFSVGALVACYRFLKRTAYAAPALTELTAIFAICVWVVSLLTSGYRGLAHCWIYFPAGYVVASRMIKGKPASTHLQQTAPVLGVS